MHRACSEAHLEMQFCNQALPHVSVHCRKTTSGLSIQFYIFIWSLFPMVTFFFSRALSTSPDVYIFASSELMHFAMDHQMKWTHHLFTCSKTAFSCSSRLQLQGSYLSVCASPVHHNGATCKGLKEFQNETVLFAQEILDWQQIPVNGVICQCDLQWKELQLTVI